MKFLVELARTTAVVLNRNIQQQIITLHFQSSTRCFSVNKSISNSPLPPDWGKARKGSGNKKLQLPSHLNTADPKIEEILAPLRASVREQVISFD
jgi:hypothetical protein